MALPRWPVRFSAMCENLQSATISSVRIRSRTGDGRIHSRPKYSSKSGFVGHVDLDDDLWNALMSEVEGLWEASLAEYGERVISLMRETPIYPGHQPQVMDVTPMGNGKVLRRVRYYFMDHGPIKPTG